jgi:hypothetical protein
MSGAEDFDEGTACGVAREDGDPPGLGRVDEGLARIDAQTGRRRLAGRAVTLVTTACQHGPDAALEEVIVSEPRTLRVRSADGRHKTQEPTDGERT